MITPLPEKIKDSLLANPAVSQVIRNWGDLALPDCWLVAGAVVQSHWNVVHGFPPLHGISDVDVIYFDPNDLTEESEAEHASRISGLFDSLPIRFDVKNEARVHLWFETRFGYSIHLLALINLPAPEGRFCERWCNNYSNYGDEDEM